MSKVTYVRIQRQDKRTLETKLERAIFLYGKKDGRIMNAVHNIATGSIGTFSERLDTCMDIIKLSK